MSWKKKRRENKGERYENPSLMVSHRYRAVGKQKLNIGHFFSSAFRVDGGTFQSRLKHLIIYDSGWAGHTPDDFLLCVWRDDDHKIPSRITCEIDFCVMLFFSYDQIFKAYKNPSKVMTATLGLFKALKSSFFIEKIFLVFWFLCYFINKQNGAL